MNAPSWARWGLVAHIALVFFAEYPLCLNNLPAVLRAIKHRSAVVTKKNL
jgi:hypothetical protein